MGVPCRCSRTGGLGQGQHSLWRIHQRRIRNSAATEKRGRAKIPSPQPPSFFARPSVIFKTPRPDFRGKRFGFCSIDTAKTKTTHWVVFVLAGVVGVEPTVLVLETSGLPINRYPQDLSPIIYHLSHLISIFNFDIFVYI